MMNTPLAEIVQRHTQGNLTPEQRAALYDELIERENAALDAIRASAAAHGMMAGLVGFALAQIGLGTPPTQEELAHLHSRMHADIEELQRRLNEGQ